MCILTVQGTAVVLAASSKQLCIDKLNAEGGRDSVSWLMHGDQVPLAIYLSMVPHGRTMYKKPGCVQIYPSVSLSSCIGKINVSIVWYHSMTSYYLQS